MRSGRVDVRIACRRVQCRGTVKLWLHHLRAGQARYLLQPGHSKQVGIKLSAAVVERLMRARGYGLLLTQTVLVFGGSTVRRPLRLSAAKTAR